MKFVDRPTQGLEARVSGLGFGNVDDFAAAGDGLLRGELGGGVFRGAGEVAGIFFAGSAFEGFGAGMVAESLFWLWRESPWPKVVVSFALPEGFLGFGEGTEGD